MGLCLSTLCRVRCLVTEPACVRCHDSKPAACRVLSQVLESPVRCLQINAQKNHLPPFIYLEMRGPQALFHQRRA